MLIIEVNLIGLPKMIFGSEMKYKIKVSNLHLERITTNLIMELEMLSYLLGFFFDSAKNVLKQHWIQLNYTVVVIINPQIKWFLKVFY